MKEIDQYIINEAKKSPLRWTLQLDVDSLNLCEFVKARMLDAIHDSELQKQLLEDEE